MDRTAADLDHFHAQLARAGDGVAVSGLEREPDAATPRLVREVDGPIGHAWLDPDDGELAEVSGNVLEAGVDREVPALPARLRAPAEIETVKTPTHLRVAVERGGGEAPFGTVADQQEGLRPADDVFERVGHAVRKLAPSREDALRLAGAPGSHAKVQAMLPRSGRTGRLAVLALVAAGTGCGPPTLAECMDRVDPVLRESGLVPEQPADLDLTVDPNLRVLTINVGNGLSETRYALRLSYQAYEDFVGAEIRALEPAIIGLQEVLPRETCLDDGEPWEKNQARTCYDSDQREDQVRRLVGPNYSIACDDIKSVDCLAVHVDFATIDGLDAGGYEPFWPGTTSLPAGFGRCDFTGKGCREKIAACDAESSVMEARLTTTSGAAIHVVHLHPSAFGQACREHQLSDAFRLLRDAKEAEPGVSLMMLGDWNMDPDRLNRPTEEILYYSHVGPDRMLREHDERDGDCARVPTGPFDLGTIDRVATDFAHGFCSVLHDTQVPLGASSPRGRLDAEFDEWGVFPKGEKDGGRSDHSAVRCDLYWPALDG